MKTSEVFTQVQKHLWDGKGRSYSHYVGSSYICDTLNWLCRERIISFGDNNKAKEAINQSLDGAWSLEYWLDIHHDIKACSTDPKTAPKLQATRKAWLDHLITHYAAKGD